MAESYWILSEERLNTKKKLEYSKEETRSRKLKNDRQYNDQKDKMTNKGQHNTTQKTKHRATRTNTKSRWWTRLLRKGKQFLLHWWHPSCYCCYKSGDKSWTRKGPNYDYDNRRLCGHLWNRYSVPVNHVMLATLKYAKWCLQRSNWEPSDFVF